MATFACMRLNRKGKYCQHIKKPPLFRWRSLVLPRQPTIWASRLCQVSTLYFSEDWGSRSQLFSSISSLTFLALLR
ncbi:hypothetical protein HBI56_140010 [Parastagonospora nodorum]|uniref:Uncharacterized protein n=1 Tax=Phaeosphaeria nodorum (strain SN15 / ATCC MYA-4574 / FGSC 10173) TaxID=321614 RepID=A0A7U2NPG6_PHANO|nr:hypothetical protein HBH56_127780 [Parastagonospora nodorum]QRD05717.1 hypothetical protein JI435_422690 [Parastagonospora nodorum SN15]KAH3931193.1 hypothetical protein HBH54_095700 [Parastagonospora nodorum]KAH3947147.1 hypothetical protein HBH53_118070 [Parastagonospora nodorum]KAH3970781.1 hypothetical protein HBH51_114500 [Parastagonospora nodorum]